MLWFGQFSIVAGEAQEEGPWAGAFPDKARADSEPSDLYVLVEPALPGSEEFSEQLVTVIGSLFHERKLSLTGGLLRALTAAHIHLRDWNRRSLKEHWVAAGVSALALRGEEAYLAQVGPTLAYIRQDGQVRVAQPHIPDAQEPLGLYDEFWPAFRRYHLGAGDSALLASSNIGTSTDGSTIEEALGQPPPEVLPALYRQVKGLTDCAALLLAFIAQDPQP